MRSRILAFVAALMVANAGYGWAQETTGAITGRVSDAQGLAVPGATVTRDRPAGRADLHGDAEGRFSVPFLTPGTYTVRAELQGFKAVEQKDVTVRLGQRDRTAAQMEVGGLAETVEVTGSSPIVDTSIDDDRRGASTATCCSAVPVGRRFSDTLYLAPGVTAAAARARQPVDRAAAAASRTSTSSTA